MLILRDQFNRLPIQANPLPYEDSFLQIPNGFEKFTNTAFPCLFIDRRKGCSEFLYRFENNGRIEGWLLRRLQFCALAEEG
jgi:hypothetical protein